MTANLTQETKDILQRSRNNNPLNPVVIGVNQGISQSMPRLNSVALSSRPQTTQQTIQSQNGTNAGEGISNLLAGGVSLVNGLGGLLGNSNSSTSDTSDGETGGGDLISNAGNVWNLYKTFGNSAGSSTAGTSAGSAMGGYGGLISGGVNGLTSFAESGDYKDGIQGVFGVDNENQSDVSQAISGTVNGAQMGASVGGPWGALIGGVLGLGSSFLDDI